MKMGKAEQCPDGTEITTEEECNGALQLANELGISIRKRHQLQTGSWHWTPHQCSYQHGGDQAFHFNSRQTNGVDQFLNGNYHMICKNGKCVLSLNLIIAIFCKTNIMA